MPRLLPGPRPAGLSHADLACYHGKGHLIRCPETNVASAHITTHWTKEPTALQHLAVWQRKMKTARLLSLNPKLQKVMATVNAMQESLRS